jgi:hypothetical protein
MAEPPKKTPPLSPEKQELLNRLLVAHRRLALSHGWLTERIDVLRQLLQLNPNHDGWRRDLANYEHARLVQIPSQAQAAFEGCDLVTLEKLVGELRYPHWRAAGAKGVRKQVEVYYRELRAQDAQFKLERVNEQLRAAQEAQDVETAKHLRDEYNRLLAIAQGRTEAGE